MARHHSQPSPRSEHEEQTVTNWRLIWITGALEVLFVVGLVLTWRFLPDSRPEPAFPPNPAGLRGGAVTQAANRSLLVRVVAPTAPVADGAPQSPAQATRPDRTKAADPVLRLSQKNIQARELANNSATRPKQLLVEARTSSTKAPLATRKLADISQPEPGPMKRINHFYAEGLAYDLRTQVPEFDLDSVKETSKKLLAKPKDGAAAGKRQTVVDLLPQRPDLAALPFAKASECQMDSKLAAEFQAYSRTLRNLSSPLMTRDIPARSSPGMRLVYLEKAVFDDPDPASARRPTQVARTETARDNSFEPKEGALRALVQLAPNEEEHVRVMVARLLASVPTPWATTTLARQALVDLSPAVRETAVLALKKRPIEKIRPLLLDGLRYPWYPVADHAAEALVALQDKQALPQLVALLDQPDPAAPAQGADKKWVVSELVRINHLRNCALCHAPSFDCKDLVRAPVPTLGKPLPEIYYDQIEGDAIRADVTYLRQDFSVWQPVPDHGPWPEKQRYDYVVRKRQLNSAQVKLLQKSAPGAGSDTSKTYAQREAVLFALRELSGKDCGISKTAWEKELANKGPASDVKH